MTISCQSPSAVHTQEQGCISSVMMSSDEVSANAVTLPILWQQLANQFGDRLALRDPHSKPAQAYSYREFYREASGFACGLQALGLAKGESVSIVSENSPRWLISDAGTMMAGLVNAPRSSVADAQELAYIVRHSRSSVVIVEHAKAWAKLKPALADYPLKYVILLSDEQVDGCITYQHVQTCGESHDFKSPSLSRQDLATLIYTSGTTGKPKGVMLTHGNLMHQVEALRQLMQLEEGDRVLSILPTWHAYERAGEYFVLSQGCTLIYTGPRYLKKDLAKEKPHFMVAVPRIWELLYDGIQQQFKQQDGVKKQLAEFFLGISDRYITQKRIAENTSLEHFAISAAARQQAKLKAAALAPLHALGDRLIYAKIRNTIAPELRYAASGGGSLPNHIDRFFELIGIEVLNGYGLTETAPVLAGRSPTHNVRGSVGRAIVGTEIQIVDPSTHQPLPQGSNGLVFARGPQVMQGYFDNPEATAKVLSPEGWFNTEDLGWLTPAGDLVLTGRAKDTIVLRNGENIEPVPLEDACSRSPYISQIVVVGQDQKRLGALVVPNEETLTEWAQSTGLSTDAVMDHKDTLALIAAELKQRVKERPGYRADDTIADFRLVPEPFTVENGLMTQTLKVKRKQAIERYADLVAEMYPE